MTTTSRATKTTIEGRYIFSIEMLITCFRKVNGRKMILGMKCDGEARVGHTLRNVLGLECQQALGLRSCFLSLEYF